MNLHVVKHLTINAGARAFYLTAHLVCRFLPGASHAATLPVAARHLGTGTSEKAHGTAVRATWIAAIQHERSSDFATVMALFHSGLCHRQGPVSEPSRVRLLLDSNSGAFPAATIPGHNDHCVTYLIDFCHSALMIRPWVCARMLCSPSLSSPVLSLPLAPHPVALVLAARSPPCSALRSRLSTVSWLFSLPVSRSRLAPA